MLNIRAAILVAILFTILACQVVPTPPVLRSTPRKVETPTRAPVTKAPEALLESPTSAVPTAPTNLPLPGELAELPNNSSSPFAVFQMGGWEAKGEKLAWPFTLPVRQEDVGNMDVVDGLTLRQRNQLLNDGFVVVHSREPQFFTQHQRIALINGQPYLLTTNSAYHALKITMDEVIRALEREELHRKLTEIVQPTFQQVISYIPLVAGSTLEPESRLAAAYLGVGLRLLDPQAALAPDIEAIVEPQVRQVLAGRGIEEAVLLPGFLEDFRVYNPPPNFANESNLANYYRGFTWFERAKFPASETGPRSYSYHVPLIVTMALRQAETESGSAGAEWVELAETLDFLRGKRSGGSPIEYALIMDQSYGRRATILSLRDDPNQETMRSLLRDLPFPQPGEALVPDLGAPEVEKSWSLLGRRAELDDLVLEKAGGKQPADPKALRWLPGGLELMSVLGSQTAYEMLKGSGNTQADFDLLDGLKASVRNMTDEQWSLTARNLWLESYRNRLGEIELDNRSNLPGFSSSHRWDVKELNSALGSWAEQRYDTTEFVPEVQEERPQVQAGSPPVPGFVEPNPQVFYSLSRLGYTFAEGLRQRDLTGVFSTNPEPGGLNPLIVELFDLSDRLQRLGDIAKRELEGEQLNKDDFVLIQSPLGPEEKRLMAQLKLDSQSENLDIPPLTGIGAIEYSDRLLHFGNGYADRIYMLVPLNGEISIAQGGIFSYYEFSLMKDRALDEQAWRWRLANDPPAKPGWSADLFLNEGIAIDVLAYRIGDTYRVLAPTGNLKLLAEPHRDAQSIFIAGEGDIFEIVGGPREANGLRWWQIRLKRDGSDPVEGWIFENREWIERVWK